MSKESFHQSSLWKRTKDLGLPSFFKQTKTNQKNKFVLAPKLWHFCQKYYILNDEKWHYPNKNSETTSPKTDGLHLKIKVLNFYTWVLEPFSFVCFFRKLKFSSGQNVFMSHCGSHWETLDCRPDLDLANGHCPTNADNDEGDDDSDKIIITQISHTVLKK